MLNVCSVSERDCSPQPTPQQLVARSGDGGVLAVGSLPGSKATRRSKRQGTSPSRHREDTWAGFPTGSSISEAAVTADNLYVCRLSVVYTLAMDVAVTELRAHLGRWIDAAREGTDIVITDRGTPVARIVAIDTTPMIDRLTAEGIISRPTSTTRPVAGGRRRPSPKHPVADIVSQQRR